MRNRIRLSGSPYRMLATDILPYERPPFFSNRMFARLMKHYAVRTDGNMLVAGRHADDEGIQSVLKLLSGNSETPRRSFDYLITKDGVAKGRKLTVIHPFHQMEMMEFYRDYETLMIYYCGRSDFSLRHPVKVAREVKGKVEFARVISDDADVNLTQEHARSYFLYERISNISQYYDNYLDLRLEKQFNYEAKVDIKECFDSIDPRLLPKLITGEEMESTGDRKPADDFASRFAELQVKFKGDGKGIVIGPEFSRLFAEMLLQQVERRLLKGLADVDLRYPKDFRMLRYVDDSFVYASTVEAINRVIDRYGEELNKVGLHLKRKKARLYKSKPFIDEISVVKLRLKRMIEKTFENRLESFKGFMHVQEGRYDEPVRIHFKEFITEMRTQVASVRMSDRPAYAKLREQGQPVEPVGENLEADKGEEKWTGWSAENEVGLYKDISNYLIAVMKNRLRDLLKKFNNLYRVYSQEGRYATISEAGEEIRKRYEEGFIDFCVELTEVLFFIFSCDPRMPVAINVVEILDEIQAFVRGKYLFSDKTKSVKFPAFHISKIDEKITDETHQVLRHKEVLNGAGFMETLTLLELQGLMFPRNRISEEVLMHFLMRVEEAESKGMPEVYNFLTIFQLIHFAEGKRGYARVKDFALKKTRPLIERFKQTGGADTESLLAVMELFSIPSLDNSLVEELSEWYKGIEWRSIKSFFDSRGDLFISWKDYSLAEEIRLLKNAEVY